MGRLDARDDAGEDHPCKNGKGRPPAFCVKFPSLVARDLMNHEAGGGHYYAGDADDYSGDPEGAALGQ
jgi:hypothetical protein